MRAGERTIVDPRCQLVRKRAGGRTKVWFGLHCFCSQAWQACVKGPHLSGRTAAARHDYHCITVLLYSTVLRTLRTTFRATTEKRPQQRHFARRARPAFPHFDRVRDSVVRRSFWLESSARLRGLQLCELSLSLSVSWTFLSLTTQRPRQNAGQRLGWRGPICQFNIGLDSILGG